jgi:PPOX class probable F420-dependent enzyme
MRRNIPVEDLGDLLERPLAAMLGIYRRDGTMLLTPVWHRWRDGRFMFQVPGGDRKIGMLERDPRVTILVAQNEFPYRGVEVTGTANLQRDRYHEIGTEIVAPYVQAYEPHKTPQDFLADGGVVVHVEPTSMRSWDYSDESYV